MHSVQLNAQRSACNATLAGAISFQLAREPAGRGPFHIGERLRLGPRGELLEPLALVTRTTHVTSQ